MNDVRAGAVIRGHVQGVGYRAFALRRAEALGLAGWVRNRSDGSVEVLVEGPGPDIETFFAHLRHGPPCARVEDVIRGPIGTAAGLAGFRILPSGY
jgi:acylphosphatase